MEKLIRYSLLLSVVSSVVSVFLAGCFLGVALVGWLVSQVQRRRPCLGFPPYFPFVLAFLLAVGVAIVFSENPRESVRYLRKTMHFLGAALVFTYFTRKLATWALTLIILAACFSGAVGVLQYFVHERVELLGRATGFMSHWMTFAGQLMIVSVVLAAWLVALTWPTEGKEVISRLGRWKLPPLGWAALLALVLVFSTLILTLTRSALFGCLAGLLIILLVRSYVWVGALLILLVVGYLALPARFTDRINSTFDPDDTTNRVRIELLRTGANVVRTHPWTGVGPRMIAKTYEEYQVSREFPSWAYQHLHNNLVQIAAEMGLVALAAWLAIWIKVTWDNVCFIKAGRRAGDRLLLWTALAALGALVAFFCAGLFEYNFGDSEILTLLLLVVTVPYVCERESSERTEVGNRTDPALL
jgi:O-antigen ligase